MFPHVLKRGNDEIFPNVQLEKIMKKIVASIIFCVANISVCAANGFHVTAIGDFSPWAWASPDQIVGTLYSDSGSSSIVAYTAGTLIDFGNPTDATSILPAAINANGQVLVNAFPPQGTKSYLIDGSTWTPIQIPRQSSYSPTYQIIGGTTAVGLTNDGTVYGWYSATNAVGTASAGFTYRNGVYRDLYDEIPSQHSRVVGVSSDNSILINAHNAYGSDYSVIRKGSQSSEVFTNPNNQHGGEITAIAMNGDGGFAGNLSTPQGGRVCRVSADGVYHELDAPSLPTPTGLMPVSTKMYLDDFRLGTRPMSSSGTIAGTIENNVVLFHSMQAPDGTLLTAGGLGFMQDGRAFVEEQGVIDVLPLPFDLKDPTASLSFNAVRAAGINDLGTVWGFMAHADYFYQIVESDDNGKPIYSLSVTSNSVNAPFVQINNEGFDVKALLDQATGVSHFSVQVIDVDDHNNVLVGAWEDGNTISPRTYVLSPVPEPEKWQYFVSGILLLLISRRISTKQT